MKKIKRVVVKQEQDAIEISQEELEQVAKSIVAEISYDAADADVTKSTAAVAVITAKEFSDRLIDYLFGEEDDEDEAEDESEGE